MNLRGVSVLRKSIVLLGLLAAACATPRPVPTPSTPTTQPTTPAPEPAPPPLPPATAIELGAQPGPALASLPGWSQADLKPALAAFVKSCRAVTRRTDNSGLTTTADWAAACAAAATATDPRAFFESHFATAVVGDGSGLNTGYFEPELAGARSLAPGYAFPLYRRPSDLIEVDLGLFSDSLKGRKVRGRVDGTNLVPYYERAQIEAGALANRGLELAYAADPYELFFLQIQGSGRLRLPDGSIMRVGYDGQNGRDYLGIGKRLREMNVLGPGQATMDGIIAWLRANPEQGRALMNENKSYVFFRELNGDGPLGALNVAVTPEVTVAADPKFVPLGAPLWLDTKIPEPAANGKYAMRPFQRLMVAQDTGGAIKGANRFDLFWGAGQRARAIAGGLSSTGRATLLLPRSAVDRLQNRAIASAQ